MTYRDDNFYIRQVLQGNSAAYANLVERHKDIVFSVIKKIIHDRLEAEELAQDVFISAYKSLSQFEGKSKFSTWLYRIAYNAAISKTRKPKKIFVSIDDPFIETQFISQVSEQSENHDLEKQIDTLYKIMEKLPPEENLLLDLFYKKDLRVWRRSTK